MTPEALCAATLAAAKTRTTADQQRADGLWTARRLIGELLWWTAMEVNDEDEARSACACGWRGPWRDRLPDVREDWYQHAYGDD